MMKHFFWMNLLWITCFSQVTFGQVEVPDYMPKEDVYPNYCTPGVEHKSRSKGLGLTYEYNPAFTYQFKDLNDQALQDIEYEFQAFRFKFKYPIINKCEFKLLVGYEFLQEEFKGNPFFGLGNPSQEDKLTFRSNRFSLISLKPLNDRNYISLAYIYATNGDYNQWIDIDRSSIHRLIATYGIKKNEHVEYGFGLYYKNGFRSHYVLPFGFYNRTFNVKWGIETIILSRVYLRYNHSHSDIFLVGGEYQSKDYALVFDNLPDVYTKYPHLDCNFVYQRKIKGWLWLELVAGYRINANNAIESISGDDLFLIEGKTNGPSGQISLFISPPKSALQSRRE